MTSEGNNLGGLTLPGFDILEPIGSGGFSVVYRAYQPRFDRHVALKILTTPVADGRSRDRFLKECGVSGRLSAHPNIVTVYDSGFTPDARAFLAIELYENGSLADRVQREGGLPVGEVLIVGAKIARALEAAHGEGIVHRDVKPQNILVSRFGEPALADFGIASLVNDVEASLTAQSLTPVHAAPEILEGRKASPQSDIYALGSTMYYLLAGRPAFRRDGDEGFLPLMLRVLQDPLPEIPRSDVPPPVTDLLEAMMAKRPEDRPATGVAVADAIKDAVTAAGLQVELGAALPVEPTPTSTPETRGRPLPPVIERPSQPSSSGPRVSSSLPISETPRVGDSNDEITVARPREEVAPLSETAPVERRPVWRHPGVLVGGLLLVLVVILGGGILASRRSSSSVVEGTLPTTPTGAEVETFDPTNLPQDVAVERRHDTGTGQEIDVWTVTWHDSDLGATYPHFLGVREATSTDTRSGGTPAYNYTPLEGKKVADVPTSELAADSNWCFAVGLVTGSGIVWSNEACTP